MKVFTKIIGGKQRCMGINSGRISKLQIRLWSDGKKGEVVYNYDRGLDFDNCPADVLAHILKKFK